MRLDMYERVCSGTYRPPEPVLMRVRPVFWETIKSLAKRYLVEKAIVRSVR